MEDVESVHVYLAEKFRWRPALSGFARLALQTGADVRAKVNGRALLLYMSMPALSGLNALVGLALPALLGPAMFGRYSLAVTLFQYGLIFDFGISQVIDRRVPVLAATDPAKLNAFVAEVLEARLYIAGITMAAGGLLLAALAARQPLPFSLLDGLLSMAAGLSFMVGLGPMAVWRALSQRQTFAASNAACAIVLAVARPVGIVLGGMTGCFGALLVCYAAIAGFLLNSLPKPQRRQPLRIGRAFELVTQGLPLFVTSIIWAFYMTANRWVVSFTAPPVELGKFAFGANVVALVVGTIAALSQLYYPMIVARNAASPRYRSSGMLARDLCGLAVAATLLAAAGIVAGPRLIEFAYPSFAGSDAPMRILLVALPNLIVSSWLMPVALAIASRPWIESALTYPLALLLLTLATWGGGSLAGIEGAAWGSCISAPLLVALQLGTLRLSRVLSWRHAGVIFLTTGVATSFLALLAAT